MRKNIRIMLPLVQVSVAACLLWSNAQRPNTFSDPAWYHPDWQVCIGLNAPAFFFANFLTNIIYRLVVDSVIGYRPGIILDTLIRLALVWFVWYVVAIETAGSGRSIITAMTRFRKLADGLAICFGGTILIAASTPVDRLGDGYARLMFIPYILWTLAIMGFYGRDLWLSSRGRST